MPCGHGRGVRRRDSAFDALNMEGIAAKKGYNTESCIWTSMMRLSVHGTLWTLRDKTPDHAIIVGRGCGHTLFDRTSARVGMSTMVDQLVTPMNKHGHSYVHT